MDALPKKISAADRMYAAIMSDDVSPDLVIEYRESLNIQKQAPFARLLGVNQSVIWRAENEQILDATIKFALLKHLMAATDATDNLAVASKDANRLNEILESIQEIMDLLHALDKIGDGISGQDGFAVSAVALAAKSVADNALDMLTAIVGRLARSDQEQQA